MRSRIAGSPVSSPCRALSWPDRVELEPLHPGGDPGRVGEVQHRLAALLEQHAGMGRRQEAVAPGERPRHRPAARHQHDVAGEVLRLAPQPVRDPRPGAGPARRVGPGAEEDLRRPMVELVGVHRPDQCDVVGALADVRQQLRHLQPALRRSGGSRIVLAITSARSGLIEKNRSLAKNDSGSFWPVSAASFGLGSKSSTWLVPPARKRKMQFLTRGGKWGGRGAIGFGIASADGPSGAVSAASTPSPFRSDSNGRRPEPAGGAGHEPPPVQGQAVVRGSHHPSTPRMSMIVEVGRRPRITRG